MTARRVSILLCASCAAALAIGVASAEGHTRVYRTFIVAYDALEYGPGSYGVETWGEIEGNEDACHPGRTLKLFFRFGDTRTLVDVTKSSRQGVWALRGFADSTPDEYVIRVTRERLRAAPGHRHICGSASLSEVPF